MEKVEIGAATLYLGDCLEVLPLLAPVDALVTDPPYGVGFKGKKTKETLNRPDLVYCDNEEYFRTTVLPAIRDAISKADRAAIFCGIRRLLEYPEPADMGAIICPNGAGRSRWGFGGFHPILFYGTSPYQARGLGSRPTCTVIYHPGMHVTKEAIGNDHPCPKPVAFMAWVVNTASLPGDTVLDPFMGSGTTCVACMNLDRRFIGIEIEPRYFDIACRRIEQAQKQLPLLEHGI